MNTYAHRDRLLADNFRICLDDLLHLEEASRGEPKHFAYEAACLELDAVRTSLRERLRAAARNAYYKTLENTGRRTTMQDKLDGFIDTWLNKTGVGDTPQNTGQCVGLVEKWLDACSMPHVWGNASDLLRSAAVPPYHITLNDPTNMPARGNIVVWDTAFGGGYGHCAICIDATVNCVYVLEQNNPEGAGVRYGLHDYSDVLGWLSW